MSRFWPLWVPFSLTVAAMPLAAQHSDLEVVSRRVPALMDSGGVPGLALAVVRAGRIQWVGGFGVRSTATGEPVGPHTVFEAASLTKPLFAYGVLMLVGEGRLDLDRPLAEYLPYEDIAHDKRYEAITARHVLRHTPGFPNWRPRGGQLTLDFTPGTKFSYSGEGFVYLQRVVEHITGEPLHAFLSRTVLGPLRMTRSGLTWENRFAADVAFGHDENGQPRSKVKPEVANAAWSLHTTAGDYALLLVALTARGRLDRSLQNEMLTPQVEVVPGVQWGLGIGLERSERGLAIWHWGHNDGYRAFAVAYPDFGDGLVMFANGDHGLSIARRLVSEVLGGSEHPALDWLDYEPYDAPSRLVRTQVEAVIADQGVEAAVARYRALRAAYSEEALGERVLNTLGYRLLRRQRVQEAIAIFRLNVEMFPTAFNVYDSLGEAYAERGDTALAIASYERSVALNPDNENGKRMLVNLRAPRDPR